jgi:serine/threonine protein kinase/tetratricopeptide (TPR) repeat protein
MQESSIASDPAIAERYEIGELLGAGGFAKVYRGRQRATRREVAIKLLELDRGPDAVAVEAQIERFRFEARFSRLDHPNIVPLIESGETAAGQPYLVLEFIPGRDLSEVLASDGQLEPAEALHLMRQVLDALSCAHAQGIVHRDLKPENIRISAVGTRRSAFVFDFGVSALVPKRASALERRASDGHDNHDSHEYTGTPAYSAPEQLRGEPTTVLSELYSWGLIFLECLTGRPAVLAKGPHEAIHLQLSPTAIQVPEALRGHRLGELLRLATQKRAERRQVETAELMRSLARVDPFGLPPRHAFALLGDAFGDNDGPSVSGVWKVGQVWRVPFARNPNFSGRKQLLERIAKSFAATERLATIALHGPGGVGKSQLALEYAYSRSDSYRVVAWLRAEHHETLAADYVALGQALGLPDTPDERQRIENVQNWLEGHGRWLLIFDNAPNPAAIRSFLPPLRAGHILLTSRHPSWKDLTSSLSVDVLELRESIEFLMARSGSADEPTAAELSEELGRLPIALDEASAYIETTGRSMRSYLRLLRTHKRDLSLGDSPVADHHRNILRTTWELSFRQIEVEAPMASDMLKLCSFLAPDEIPLALWKRGGTALPETLQPLATNDVALDRCVATLRRFSLVKADAETLSIHRLVQLATHERLSPEARDRWAVHALALVEAAYPRQAAVGAYRPEAGRFLPHALIVLGRGCEDPEAVAIGARLRRRVGVYLSARGSQLEAWDFLEHALRDLEAQPDPDRLQVGAALWELGMVLYALGEANAARELLRRGLATLHDVADSQFLRGQLHLALGWVERARGDFRATRDAGEQAQACLVSTVGGIHHLTAMAFALQGRGFWCLGDMLAARSCLDAALEILRAAAQPRHALNCGTWYCIAQLQYHFEEFENALASSTRAVEIGQQAYGRDHPFVSTSLSVRGASLLQLGHLSAARECCVRALDSGHRACLHLHEDIAVARVHLAETLRRSGDYSAAAEQLTHTLEELPRLCGDSTRVAWSAHLSFAQLSRDRGDLEAAREHCARALQLFDARYSPVHPGRAQGAELSASLEDERRDSSFVPRESVIPAKHFFERTVEHAQAAVRRLSQNRPRAPRWFGRRRGR